METVKETELTFLISPEIVPGIDLAKTYRQDPKPILNLITSKFPAGSFCYQAAKQGKPFLGCNEFPITNGKISVCLHVYRERHQTGWLDCSILLFSPLGQHFQMGHEPDGADPQLFDLCTKLKTTLIDLGAKDVIIHKGLSPRHSNTHRRS